MFEAKFAFSGISVDNLPRAKQFYTEVLGLVIENEEMALQLRLPNGGVLFLYPKPNHQPATYTVLNFVVDDIDQAVDALQKQGVKFETYDDMPAKQDEKKILRGLKINRGPDIAWFKDPAGNILSVLQDK